MSDVGRTNIVVMWTVGPDDVAEGDRIFASHVDFMTGHSRNGDTALISYKISKGPELANPVDPNSEPTGNTIFVLNEVYETPAGAWRCRTGRICPPSWTGAPRSTSRRCIAGPSSRAFGDTTSRSRARARAAPAARKDLGGVRARLGGLTRKRAAAQRSGCNALGRIRTRRSLVRRQRECRALRACGCRDLPICPGRRRWV